MKRIFTAALLTLSIAAHASDESEEAYSRSKIAAATDVASTMIGVSSGVGVEGNPAGVVGMMAIKAIALSITADMPDAKKLDYSNKMTAVWGGMSASNICLLLGGGPGCYLVGLIAGINLWDNRVKPIEKEI